MNATKVTVEGGRTLTLKARDFVAEGGEGRIWARRGVAYKIYLDPARSLPDAKLAALRTIDCSDAILPDRRLLAPGTGNPVGYTMRHVAGAWVLGQLFARSFCDRHGFDPAAARTLITRMQRALTAIHRAGVLVVDLSDVNVLVDPTDHSPAFIDADSWQTPGHPATAVTPATRDPLSKAAGFSTDSDWYSFAILSFQLLVGIHPFRGKHATVKGLSARMQANLSVLDADVGVPAAARNLDAISPSYRAWYEALFVHGHRGPPPAFDATTTLGHAPRVVGPRLVAATQTHALQTHALQIVVVGAAASIIRQLVPGSGTAVDVWLRTDDGVVPGIAGPVVHAAPSAGRLCALGVDATHGTWVLATADADRQGLTLAADATIVGHRVPSRVDAMTTTADGRIVVQSGEHLLELVVTALGRHRIRVTPRRVAQVMPHATFLGVGVAITNMLGRAHASLLTAPGCSPQVRLPELDGHRIVDAKFDRGVLVVSAQPPREGSGRVSVLTAVFDPRGQRVWSRLDNDVDDPSVDLVVSDDGKAIIRRDHDTLEILGVGRSARATAPAAQRLDAAALGRGWLARTGNGSVVWVQECQVAAIGRRAQLPGPVAASPGVIPVR